MNAHSTVPLQDASLPEELASPRAKLVYLYLTTTSSATVDELQTGLDLSKMALFTIVRTLRERGLVEKRGHEIAVVR